MELLRHIRRKLRWNAFKVLITDDQRAWRGITISIAASHLAERIRRTTNQDKVGIMLPTSGLFPVGMIASWTLGRTIVPLNYLLTAEDIAYIIEDAGLDTVITVGPMVDFVGGLPEHVKQIRMEELSYKGLPPRQKRVPMAEDDLAVLLYTSGTSGKPKGVMLTCGNVTSNVMQCRDWADFRSSDVMLGVLPQFHSFGLTVLTLMPLALGCRMVYTAKFVPRRLLELARKHRPTALIAIPSMYNALRLQKSGKPADFESLRFTVSGGEPLSDAVFEGFKQRYGITINEGYGLTETSPVTNWCRPGEDRRGSVGMPLDGVIERIVDLDGNELGPNQDGEIRIKGPNVMKGYYNLPEETAAVFDEHGFFRTGDMGRLDDDGFLYITGRIKEMLIIGGENVFPREIEEILQKHPSVQACAIIGQPDPSRGEVPLAFVEMVEGATFDESELRAYCREQLPQFKVPREIRHLQELPRNATGKIMRRKLTPETAMA